MYIRLKWIGRYDETLQVWWMWRECTTRSPYSSVVEHPLSKRKVRSSILRGGKYFFFHHSFSTFNFIIYYCGVECIIEFSQLSYHYILQMNVQCVMQYYVWFCIVICSKRTWLNLLLEYWTTKNLPLISYNISDVAYRLACIRSLLWYQAEVTATQW